MRIGKNLIRYRFAKGWSQEDLVGEVVMLQRNYIKIDLLVWHIRRSTN